MDSGIIGGGKSGGIDTGFTGLDTDVGVLDVGAESNKLVRSSIADAFAGTLDRNEPETKTKRRK